MVDLPLPLSPKMASVSPRSMEKETSTTTMGPRGRYRLDRPCTSISIVPTPHLPLPHRHQRRSLPAALRAPWAPAVKVAGALGVNVLSGRRKAHIGAQAVLRQSLQHGPGVGVQGLGKKEGLSPLSICWEAYITTTREEMACAKRRSWVTQSRVRSPAVGRHPPPRRCAGGPAPW